MPSLTRKVIKGRPYYYLRHCQRVDGRPKIVKTTYLGSAEQLLARLAAPTLRPQPRAVEIATLGDVAALYDVARQLDLVALIDAHLPKREQGLSVGQYLLLAVLNRATHPTSKARLADWYQRTVLPRLLPAGTAQLSSQAFWNHMERVSEADITAIETELSQRVIARFNVSLRTLVYDGTNFFTYLTTTNPATLPARGHNKQKRTDLRQVNLGLLVSTDFHVPLFHQVYTGNVHDATEFKTITEELRARYQQLAQGQQLARRLRAPRGLGLSLRRLTRAHAAPGPLGRAAAAVPAAAGRPTGGVPGLPHHQGRLRRRAHRAGDPQRKPARRPVAGDCG
jgi:hypothetical protein